jgi:phage terminase small subunit
MAHGGARVGAGRKKALPKAEARPVNVQATVEAPVADVVMSGRTPLDYMLFVMNDPGADERLRAQMAVAAAPYLHPKMGEGGKKDLKQDAAKKAAGGKFKPAVAPPLKLVAQR